jgi:hypothetical protein
MELRAQERGIGQLQHRKVIICEPLPKVPMRFRGSGICGNNIDPFADSRKMICFVVMSSCAPGMRLAVDLRFEPRLESRVGLILVPW